MNTNYAYPDTPAPAPQKRRNIALIVVIVAIVLFCCCCIVAAAVVVFVDPFKLHIKDRLLGGSFDAAAEAMPADTSLYAGVNLLGANPNQLDRIIQPFAEALDIDQRTWEDMMDEIDRSLSEQFDITMTDDVKPWIGQYIGIGITDIRMDDSENPVSLIVSAESRDNNAADRFIEKLTDAMAQENGGELNESEYQGATIYSWQPEYGTGFAIGRSGSLVLFGLSENDLQTAIDAQKGDSLVDEGRYRDMVEKLPGKRIVTMYYTSQEIADLLNEIQSQTGDILGQMSEELGGVPMPQTEITDINLDLYDSTILSLSITDAGIQFDGVTSYNMENMTEVQREMLQNMSITSKTVDMFPEDTLMFLTSQRLDLTYDVAIETMRDMNQDASDSIDNALKSVQEAMGIDLEDDLFHLLDGEFAIGLFPSNQGMLAEQANISVGFALLAESSDMGAIANTMDMLSSKLEEEGVSVDRFESGDLSMYEFLQSPGGDVVFAGGMDRDFMSLATSSQTIEDLFAGNGPLADSSRYREAVGALPDGVTPMLYLDVEGIMGVIRETLTGYSREDFDSSTKVLQPVPYVVLGYSEFKDDIMRMTLIIHVK